MVSVTCQLDWPRMPRLNLPVNLWGCFQMRLAVESADSVKQVALPSWVGLSRSVEDVNRAGVRGERNSPLFFLASLIELGYLVSASPALGPRLRPSALPVAGPADSN